MNEISINGKKHYAPGNWNEVEKKHLLAWVKIMRQDIEKTHAFGAATMLFYSIKAKLYFKMPVAHHVQLKETLRFLSEGNNLTKWVIKRIAFWPFRRYHGPANYMGTSTMQEFRFAELFYHAYQKNKEGKYLDQLIATLYRKKGKSNLNQDCRIQVSQLYINGHAIRMKRLNKPLREAILFNYEGCRNFIFKKYPTIFRASSNSVKSASLPDMVGIIDAIAGGKFGTAIQTEDTLIYRFLDHLAAEISAAEKAKRK